MEHHVHAADAEHGGVEVVAVEGSLAEAAAGGGVPEDSVAVVFFEVFRGSHEEARRAAGGVADHVLGDGSGHVRHEADDVPGGAELAVLPRRGNFAQHVLVEVALGVPVVHVDGVELVHHACQHPGGGYEEHGVLHVAAVGAGSFAVAAVSSAEVLDEGEDFVPDDPVHLLGGHVPEAGPTEVLPVGGKDGIVQDFSRAGRPAFLQGLEFVEPLDEEQVGELLDDRERVGDAPGPHGVPYAVDAGFDFSGDHAVSPCVFLLCRPGASFRKKVPDSSPIIV